MNRLNGLFVALCACGFLAHATHAADAPADAKRYSFELQTLNMCRPSADGSFHSTVGGQS